MRKHFDIAVFADQADDAQVETFDLEIPENLSDLSSADLGDLRSKAVDAFQTLYAGGEFTDEDLATLGTLTEGIEALSAEISTREQAAAERAAKAAEMAAKVGADKPAPASDDEEDAPAEEKAEAEADIAEAEAEKAEKKAKAAAADVEPAAEVDAEPETEAVTAAAPRGPIKLSGIRRHVHTPAPAITEETSVEDTAPKARMTVADVPGFAADSDASFEDLAVALDRRLQGFNSGAYAAAARAGRAMSERHSLAVVRKAFDERATVGSPESADAAMAFAVNEKNLPGGSLVAAGGWCAPSETVYDLLEDESREGLISLPEINVTRGGIKFTKGPKFADLYAAPSFNFTEAEAKEGKYQPTSATDPTNKVGAKPVYHVPCTDFEEVRLSAAGLHIQAGLLQQRGYPELVARTIRGALVAHEHKMSERIIASMETQSTAVSMDAGQIGAAAPILTAIELQVEHYRYAQRLSRSTTPGGGLPLLGPRRHPHRPVPPSGRRPHRRQRRPHRRLVQGSWREPPVRLRLAGARRRGRSLQGVARQPEVPALLGGHLRQGQPGRHHSGHRLRLGPARPERLHRPVHRGGLPGRQARSRRPRRDCPAQPERRHRHRHQAARQRHG